MRDPNEKKNSLPSPSAPRSPCAPRKFSTQRGGVQRNGGGRLCSDRGFACRARPANRAAKLGNVNIAAAFAKVWCGQQVTAEIVCVAADATVQSQPGGHTLRGGSFCELFGSARPGILETSATPHNHSPFQRMHRGCVVWRGACPVWRWGIFYCHFSD